MACQTATRQIILRAYLSVDCYPALRWSKESISFTGNFCSACEKDSMREGKDSGFNFQSRDKPGKQVETIHTSFSLCGLVKKMSLPPPVTMKASPVHWILTKSRFLDLSSPAPHSSPYSRNAISKLSLTRPPSFAYAVQETHSRSLSNSYYYPFTQPQYIHLISSSKT